MSAHNELMEAFDALVGITEMAQEQSYASMTKFFDDLLSVYSSNLEQQIEPDTIEASYTGLHLNDDYEIDDLLRMIDNFRNGQIIHAKYAIKILDDAIKLHRTYPNVSKFSFAKSKTNLPACIIVGDLHGSLKDLCYIIERFGVPGLNYRFVFNGDFVDRGPHQCEVLIILLYSCLLFPSRVFLNRGNHEDLSVNLNKHFDPNFKQDTQLKFNKYGLAFFNKAQQLFQSLPLATIVENNVGYRLFVVHGGLSTRVDLDYVQSKELDRFSFASITLKKSDEAKRRRMAEQLVDLLWSDPMTSKSPLGAKKGCIRNEARGIAWLFGEDVSKSFCKKYNFNAIVRSHEARADGYSQDHPHCYTVFSSSYYCHGSNSAAVLVVGANEACVRPHQFKTTPLDRTQFENERKQLLASFKLYLERECAELMAEFGKHDVHKRGHLDLNKWAAVLSDHVKANLGIDVERRHFITLKDYLCPCNETWRSAEYAKMFSNSNMSSSANGGGGGGRNEAQLLEFLDSVFQMIDLDHNGSISMYEAERAMALMNTKLGTKYDTNFIKELDKNSDGLVDLSEFRLGFIKAYQINSIQTTSM